MKEIRTTDVYRRWYQNLRDRRARRALDARVERLRLGHAGDVRPVGRGVSELRIHHGPGYRVYFTERGDSVVVLLAGGDKSSQRLDIRRAIEIAEDT